jgi:hypothetical protein
MGSEFARSRGSQVDFAPSRALVPKRPVGHNGNSLLIVERGM